MLQMNNKILCIINAFELNFDDVDSLNCRTCSKILANGNFLLFRSLVFRFRNLERPNLDLFQIKNFINRNHLNT